MFIDFGGMMINTDYIVSIYKTGQSDKYYEINIKLFNNSSSNKEIYSDKEQRDKRFNEIINKLKHIQL